MTSQLSPRSRAEQGTELRGTGFSLHWAWSPWGSLLFCCLGLKHPSESLASLPSVFHSTCAWSDPNGSKCQPIDPSLCPGLVEGGTPEAITCFRKKQGLPESQSILLDARCPHKPNCCILPPLHGVPIFILKVQGGEDGQARWLVGWWWARAVGWWAVGLQWAWRLGWAKARSPLPPEHKVAADTFVWLLGHCGSHSRKWAQLFSALCYQEFKPFLHSDKPMDASRLGSKAEFTQLFCV